MDRNKVRDMWETDSRVQAVTLLIEDSSASSSASSSAMSLNKGQTPEPNYMPAQLL